MTELLLGGAAGLAVLTLLMIVLRSPALLTLAFLLWALNMTWAIPPELKSPAVAAGLVIVVVAGLKCRADRREIRRVPPVAFVPVAAGILGLALSGSSPDVGETVTFSILAILLGVAAAFIARTVPGTVVARSGFYSLTVIVAVSALAVVVGADEAVINDRWTGITPNPNTLGLLAALWVATSFAFPRRVVLVVAPLALLLAVLTGSRGGSLAVLAGAAAGLWAGGLLRPGAQGKKWPQRLLLMGAMAVLAWAVAGALGDPRRSAGELIVLRGSDSGRLTLTEANWDLFLAEPLMGHGFGIVLESVGGAHFSPVVYAVQLGVLGLMLFAAAVFLLLNTGWRTRPVLAALVFAGLVETIAEAWLFGAGSMLTGVFWLSVAALAADPVESHGMGPPSGEMGTDQQTRGVVEGSREGSVQV